MSNKLFVRPSPKSKPRIRLFCFPFAGGGINTYLNWTDKFDDEVELILIQPPGRGTRLLETPHNDMDSLVDELMQHADFISQEPYLFFGHSLGSRVAFELCCRLKANNKPLPMHFIASGSHAPHLISRRDRCHDLPQNEFIRALDKLDGTPKEVLENNELMALLLPLLRADFRIAETYVADKVIMPFPILTFHGESDLNLKIEYLDAWSDLTEKEHRLVIFEGDHFFINKSCEQVVSYIISLMNSLFR